jgi:hypothetical protein
MSCATCGHFFNWCPNPNSHPTSDMVLLLGLKPTDKSCLAETADAIEESAEEKGDELKRKWATKGADPKNYLKNSSNSNKQVAGRQLRATSARGKPKVPSAKTTADKILESQQLNLAKQDKLYFSKFHPLHPLIIMKRRGLSVCNRCSTGIASLADHKMCEFCNFCLCDTCFETGEAQKLRAQGEEVPLTQGEREEAEAKAIDADAEEEEEEEKEGDAQGREERSKDEEQHERARVETKEDQEIENALDQKIGKEKGDDPDFVPESPSSPPRSPSSTAASTTSSPAGSPAVAQTATVPASSPSSTSSSSPSSSPTVHVAAQTVTSSSSSSSSSAWSALPPQMPTPTAVVSEASRQKWRAAVRSEAKFHSLYENSCGMDIIISWIRACELSRPGFFDTHGTEQLHQVAVASVNEEPEAIQSLFGTKRDGDSRSKLQALFENHRSIHSQKVDIKRGHALEIHALLPLLALMDNTGTGSDFRPYKTADAFRLDLLAQCPTCRRESVIDASMLVLKQYAELLADESNEGSVSLDRIIERTLHEMVGERRCACGRELRGLEYKVATPSILMLDLASMVGKIRSPASSLRNGFSIGQQHYRPMLFVMKMAKAQHWVGDVCYPGVSDGKDQWHFYDNKYVESATGPRHRLTTPTKVAYLNTEGKSGQNDRPQSSRIVFAIYVSSSIFPPAPPRTQRKDKHMGSSGKDGRAASSGAYSAPVATTAPPSHRAPMAAPVSVSFSSSSSSSVPSSSAPEAVGWVRRQMAIMVEQNRQLSVRINQMRGEYEAKLFAIRADFDALQQKQVDLERKINSSTNRTASVSASSPSPSASTSSPSPWSAAPRQQPSYRDVLTSSSTARAPYIHASRTGRITTPTPTPPVAPRAPPPQRAAAQPPPRPPPRPPQPSSSSPSTRDPPVRPPPHARELQVKRKCPRCPIWHPVGMVCYRCRGTGHPAHCCNRAVRHHTVQSSYTPSSTPSSSSSRHGYGEPTRNRESYNTAYYDYSTSTNSNQNRKNW